MPWMQHGNIVDFIERNGWSEPEVLGFVREHARIYYVPLIMLQIVQILDALAYLHRLDVVHGDLHPVRRSLSL